MDMPMSRRHAMPLGSLTRLSAILVVLAKHGWGHYIERLGLKGYLGTAPAAASGAPPSGAERLRLTLEELGPTFVKFGQLLSVREDLFEEKVTAELRKLQEAVAPFPAAEARRIIEQELGGPVETLFVKFDDAPLAAASMAQVHSATLPDATGVIVKVQRPGIEQVIRSDLDILFALARLLQRYVPESRHYDPLGLVEEFSGSIVKELDFRQEGHSGERFADQFRGEPAVYVPRIFWELSAQRVLTQEFSTGHRADPDYPAEAAERRRLAQTLARLFLAQIFEYGFFHGDPHPGNVFIMHDGRLCFHDFGIVGRLSPRDQENLRLLVLAVVTRDAEAMAELYFDMGVAPAEVEREAFARDLSKSLEQYYAITAPSYSFGEILRQFIRIGQRYQIRMPREWLLVVKAFMVTEAQAAVLDPQFSMIDSIKRYAPRMLARRLMPEFSAMSGLVKGYRMMDALRLIAFGLPDALARALRQLQKGEVVLRVRHDKLDDLERHLDRASNRLSFSLLIAAIVIASSIVMTAHLEPHYEGLPILGLIGYGIAAVLGLWWAIAILRSGRL